MLNREECLLNYFGKGFRNVNRYGIKAKTFEFEPFIVVNFVGGHHFNQQNRLPVFVKKSNVWLNQQVTLGMFKILRFWAVFDLAFFIFKK